jgi:hypothetical protein
MIEIEQLSRRAALCVFFKVVFVADNIGSYDFTHLNIYIDIFGRGS